MRLIDADALKKDLTRFYDNEVTAKRLIDEQPTIEPEPYVPDTNIGKMSEIPIGSEVLDKIRAEIDAHREKLKIMADDDWYAGKIRGYDCAIEIIDKYTAESEDKE